MMAVKEALEEAGGDEEKAIEILRKRGLAQAVKKSARDQTEGAVFIAASGNRAALLELKCETDFVARSDDFLALGQELTAILLEHGSEHVRGKAEEKVPSLVQKLGENIGVGDLHEVEAPSIGSYVHSNRKIGVVIGLDAEGKNDVAKDIAMHAAAMSPQYKTPEDVPPHAIEKEKEIWREQLSKEGKPAQIHDKIMIGKEKKFREEQSLTKQAFVKDPSKSVEQLLGGSKVVSYVRVSI
jgi:elongation factor Ts